MIKIPVLRITRKVTVKLAVLSTGIAVGCLYVAGLFAPNDASKE